jgi:hypothetical protein
VKAEMMKGYSAHLQAMAPPPQAPPPRVPDPPSISVSLKGEDITALGLADAIREDFGDKPLLSPQRPPGPLGAGPGQGGVKAGLGVPAQAPMAPPGMPDSGQEPGQQPPRSAAGGSESLYSIPGLGKESLGAPELPQAAGAF